METYIMASNVNITSKGIQKILKNYNPQQAIAEYIWNGFDANANTIDIKYFPNELGGMGTISISDNGYGINFNNLKQKFNPFYESEKTIEISNPKHTSVMHGRNGVGRLTFFTFAHLAKWSTTYKDGSDLHSGSIVISAGGLNTYDPNEESVNSDRTGTTVDFYNIQISKEDFEISIVPFLVSEFCWFLELNKDKNYKIIVNGDLLDYQNNIVNSEEEVDIVYKESNTHFKVRYIQWQAPLHKEYSKYYFINGNKEEVYKDYTTLNNKGDEFYHSVYIQSPFFSEFDFKSSDIDTQSNLFGKAKTSPEYKYLIKTINKYLRDKRKPYLRTFATRLIEEFEQDGIFPEYKNEWEEKYKKPQLQETLIGLYEAQPKLFSSLNISQKKTFVRFLDLLLDSNERDRLFVILDEIIELDSEERQDLEQLFKTTKLNRIIETIKLIEDRYKVIYQLRDLVYNPDLKADEVHHLQKAIESHYWIFGEQYHLVTAAEPKFDEALRRYHYLLYQEDVDAKIEHPDKYKEMDIFACRQNTLVNKIENIVIELKHPNINIGRKQYNQVDKYLEVIRKEPLFNASNMSWEFYLVGKDFDTSGQIERLLESHANHGIPSLIHWFEKGRVKVFAKRWSEVFAEFEINHKFLNEKLLLERNFLVNELTKADEVIISMKENTAIQPQEADVPF